MATNPAQVTSATSTAPASNGEPDSRASAFKEFLRRAPQNIDRQYIESRLLNSSKHFRTKKDISNAIIYAQAKKGLSLIQEDQSMRNFLSGKSGSNGKGPHAPPRRSARTGGTRSAAPASDEQVPRGEGLRRVLDSVLNLGDRAVIDETVTKDQIINSLLRAGAAIRSLMRAR